MPPAARSAPAVHPDDEELAEEDIPAPAAGAPRRSPLAIDLGEDEPAGNAIDEARAETLAERLRADPTDLEVVLELAACSIFLWL